MSYTPPPVLKTGDTIGVMAPSSYVEREDIEASKAVLEERGYKVFIHPQTYEREHQSAGNHLQKSLALQGLWQRDDIHAIWAAGGGNRAMHLLDTINFEKMKAKPKALIGFSDVTALLNAVTAHTGIISFHGPVLKNLKNLEKSQLTQCLDLLAGEKIDIPLKSADILREGTANGPLIGGCLSIFQYLAGGKDCPPLEDAILFLEDASDHISRFDRMFLHLKRLDVFEKIAGLILGEFVDLQDGSRPFGYSLQDILQEHTENTDFPIIMNAPFGHGQNLFTFPVGGFANLDISSSKNPQLIFTAQPEVA